MTPPHVLLLTGRPGVGKTTAIRKVAAALSGRRLAGFYTEEIRAGRERRGFRAVTLDGRARTMAHVEVPGRARVGRYGVDIGVVDWLADSTLTVTSMAEVYLVDEIGKMECMSPRFVTAMRALLTSPPPVVATIAERGEGLIDEVKRRDDVELWRLTPANRDDVPERVLTWLTALLRAS